MGKVDTGRHVGEGDEYNIQPATKYNQTPQPRNQPQIIINKLSEEQKTMYLRIQEVAAYIVLEAYDEIFHDIESLKKLATTFEPEECKILTSDLELKRKSIQEMFKVPSES